MTTFRILLVLSLVACGGSKKDTNPVGGPGEPAIDPTLPSWAPASCTTYQKAVFQAINCDAMDQGKRDEIKDGYNAASVNWKQENEADAAKIEEVNQSCTTNAESVRVAIGDLCTADAP